MRVEVKLDWNPSMEDWLDIRRKGDSLWEYIYKKHWRAAGGPIPKPGETCFADVTIRPVRERRKRK